MITYVRLQCLTDNFMFSFLFLQQKFWQIFTRTCKFENFHCWFLYDYLNGIIQTNRCHTQRFHSLIFTIYCCVNFSSRYKSELYPLPTNVYLNSPIFGNELWWPLICFVTFVQNGLIRIKRAITGCCLFSWKSFCFRFLLVVEWNLVR